VQQAFHRNNILDSFLLGTSAINLLAPYLFSTLSILIKAQSSFDTILVVYQQLLMTSANSHAGTADQLKHFEKK